MLKSFVKIQLVLLAAVVFSCGDDDDSKEQSFSFINQDVQGEIWGASWQYTDGNWRMMTLDEEDRLSFALYPTYDEAPCFNALSNYGNFVNTSVPYEVGLYKPNATDPDLPIVYLSLFNGETGDAIYVQEGAIEILTITETEVTGRIYARHDDSNYINGNFTIPVCILEDDQ